LLHILFGWERSKVSVGRRRGNNDSAIAERADIERIVGTLGPPPIHHYQLSIGLDDTKLPIFHCCMHYFCVFPAGVTEL
jgi:hypothetical protein